MVPMVLMVLMVTVHHLSAHKSKAWLQMVQEETGAKVSEALRDGRSAAAMISIPSVFPKYMMHRWSVLWLWKPER